MAPCGYAMDFATTGADGLSKYTSNPNDIVALDHQLLDMTGLDI